MLTLEEMKGYLHIDYDDEGTNQTLERLGKAAEQYLIGSLGEDFPRDDERARELALLLVSDLYDNRGMYNDTKVSNAVRHLVHSMSLQLRLEAGNDAGGPV